MVNLFYLDSDPCTAAQLHCDKHVGKMLLETVQMMSTALRGHGLDVGYRATHANHPVCRWVASNAATFAFAFRLAEALAGEYRFRFDRGHKSAEMLPVLAEVNWTTTLGAGSWLPPPQCMPETYRREDPVAAYRAFYRGEKARFARYTRRPVPDFLVDLVPPVAARSMAVPRGGPVKTD